MKRLIIETCCIVYVYTSRNVDFLLLLLLRYLILSTELFSNSHFLIIPIFTRNTHFERHILFKCLPVGYRWLLDYSSREFLCPFIIAY